MTILEAITSKLEDGLEDFLKSEKVFDKFILNILNEWGVESLIEPFLHNYIISSSITWDKSPEGLAFWQELNYKYCLYKETKSQENEY